MNEYLLEQIAAPENLLAAWRAVRGNIPRQRRQHAGGPDGISMADYERDLTTELAVLREALVNEKYQPVPPKIFDLPKKGGGVRTIALLSVRDRVAQRAAQQIIEPLWEPAFLPCSFGFRPGLSTLHAAAYVQQQHANGLSWLVDGDIQACFDHLDHELLMRIFGRKVRDGRVLRLLQAWLDSGAGTAGLPEEPVYDTQVDAAALAKQGLSWLLELIGAENDPYAAARYEGSGMHTPENLSTRLRSTSLRHMALEGLAVGAAWMRPALGKLGDATRTLINTPAGRRVLRRGALVSGGLAGAAAAAALAAWWLNHRAGPVPSGVFQGSPLSPLLANIYLHPFDVHLCRLKLHLARYADDWVICCRTKEEAEMAYNQALKALAALHLKANLAKTQIVAPGSPLKWLGITIR
jgi:RNA-directed DNA polymerase